MEYIDKYEGITGQELPRKMTRKGTFVYLSLKDFLVLKKSDGSPSWGSVQNNPCVLYTTEDGRTIEEYNWSTRFIQEVKSLPIGPDIWASPEEDC